MTASRSGKIPTTSVRRRISRLSRSLGLLDQIWRQISFGNAVKARTSARAASRCSATAGSLLGQGVEDPVELGVHGVGVGLVVDRVQHRLDPGPSCSSGSTRHQVRGVVGAAALPGRAGQVRRDRLDQAGVGVGGDQLHPGQAAGDQVGGRTRIQPAPVSLVATSTPRTSRCPSALTPVATSTTALTTRPSSRTFIVNASAATNVNGPGVRAGGCGTPRPARRGRRPSRDLRLRQPGDPEGLRRACPSAGSRPRAGSRSRPP